MARKKTASAKSDTSGKSETSGKLKIGDHWNAITIIALSQSNPLKAIAEFVENSIDARAQNISIVRGKRHGAQYLKVIDDGEGVADFRYVATHIGDSIKRKLKEHGAENIQGEFGIGLLSFWTVGEELAMSSVDAEGVGRRMKLVKGQPTYSIRSSGNLFDRPGTELDIHPLLPGVRMLSGEKIQAYLASELRDRIAKSGVQIRIVDRSARKDLLVVPRQFEGRLIHGLPDLRTPFGEVYVELYESEASPDHAVGLYRSGTRVIADITTLDAFARPPWNTRHIEGIIDAGFLQLTPGTRDGVIYDDAFEALVTALQPAERELERIIEERKRAEEEEASKAIMRKVTRALKEAFLMLPREQYGWLSAQASSGRGSGGGGKKGTGEPGAGDEAAGGARDDAGSGSAAAASAEGGAETAAESRVNSAGDDPSLGLTADSERTAGRGPDREFFEYPGPLYRLTISPASCTVGVGRRRKLHALARDRARRAIDADISITWRTTEGAGSLSSQSGEFVEFIAPEEPGLARVEARAVQGETECSAEAVITVTAELIPRAAGDTAFKHGLPGYTYEHAPGRLWRSKYNIADSVIVINNAHADFVFASRQTATKLRYIARLYAKEIVLANFPEATKDELLERLVELMLYMETHLK